MIPGPARGNSSTVRWLSRHHVHDESGRLTGLVLLAVVLWLAAGVGMCYVAGFGTVQSRLGDFRWPWLIGVAGGLGLGFVGYYLAYRGIEQVEGGPDLDEPSLRAVVTAGWGGFLAHGGAALDDFAMRAGGVSDREANVRVSALAGFEHGVMAIGASAAAIAVLVAGIGRPTPDFTLPWAILPALGFALAFWAAERYRNRLRDRKGWRGKTGVFLDAIHLTRELFRRPRDNDWAALGMALYWVGDFFALWAALAAFGFHMNVASFTVAAATAMIVTRRTGPLGGAGILTVALVPTIWYSGAPWAAAALGVAAFRGLSLLLPLPFSLAMLPRLRALGEKGEETPGYGTSSDEGEPALEH
jgi:hypothetical protein